MSRNWRLFLADMSESADSILAEVAGLSREAFDADSRVRKIILHDLPVLGEAAKHVPEEVRARHPEVPWRKIAGLRDVIAHSYYRLDDDVIWNIATSSLHTLKPALEKIAAEEDGEGSAGVD